ncbi:MAG: hypothetical protein ABEL76_01835 [Bradymonadaceae bacterium]
MKYRDDGTRDWVRLVGSSGADVAYDVAAGPEGAVYLVGETDGELPDKCYNGGQEDGFVAKYTASGDRRWIKPIGTRGTDSVFDVAVSGTDGVYIAGMADKGIGGGPLHGYAVPFVARVDVQ